MKNDPQRDSRDAAATVWHNKAVASGQTERMLVRAIDGELVSYLPEEYGLARMTYGNTITSVWGNRLMAGFMIAIMAGISLSILLAGRNNPGQPPLWLWLMPLAFAALAIFFGKHALKEERAVRLRRERGMPAPTSQTVDSKWHRAHPRPGK